MNKANLNTLPDDYIGFEKLSIPEKLLFLISFTTLVFPIIPLALLAVLNVLQFPSSSENNLMPVLWFLGGPIGMIGLFLTIVNKRNIITILFLVYGVISYFPLLFPFFSDIKPKKLLDILNVLYFSLPIIVAIIHIGLSIRSIWVNWKATP